MFFLRQGVSCVVKSIKKGREAMKCLKRNRGLQCIVSNGFMWYGYMSLEKSFRYVKSDALPFFRHYCVLREKLAFCIRFRISSILFSLRFMFNRYK